MRPRSLIAGALIDSVLSTLLALVFTLSHRWFVLNNLIGRNARWVVFLVASETTGLPIVDRVDALLAEPAPSQRIMDEGIGRNSDALLTA